MMGQTALHGWIGAVLFILFHVHNVFAIDAGNLQLQKEDLAVGYIRGQFYRVNRSDAEAAFKTLARTLGVRHGYEVDVTVESFENGEEVEAYLVHSKLHLIIYNSLDYQRTESDPKIEPLFVPTEDGHIMRRYVLLSQNPALNSLAALQNRSLNIYYGPNNSLGVKWLELLLQQRFGLGIGAFFGSVDDHEDPLAAILPVFFGKRDAVLVDFDKFELMVELNPQLNQLYPVIVSEPYLSQVICFNHSGWSSEQFRKDMLKAMAKLHETPAGQQILMLFKADRIVPFEPGFLESVRRLGNDVLYLGKKPAKPSADKETTIK